MPEVMEMKVGDFGPLTGPFKPLPGITELAPVLIVKDPGHVNSGPEAHQHGPHRLIRWEYLGLPRFWCGSDE